MRELERQLTIQSNSSNAKMTPASRHVASEIENRVTGADWHDIGASLNSLGFAIFPQLLSREHCIALTDGYSIETQFRNRVLMARHGFGRGEYKYFDYPLPDLVHTLRPALYRHLAPIASRWMQRLRLDIRFPPTLSEFLTCCHAAGQTRPTPLLLKYESGDYNRLHQDLYGATVFPIQVAVLLSSPGADFDGGEFVLVEQRPRMQSRATVVPLQQGDAAIFAVNERPVAGTKGDSRVKLRHGVSQIRSGQRYTLGIIFHDAA